ncbi:MAG: hypothetical protein RJA33_396 [Actinomycetota bacterium]|jgi:hypothetical protein
MELAFANKKKVGQIAGIFGAFIALTFGQTSQSYAGVINSTNATNAVGKLAAAVVGAAAGGAVAGSFAGPPGAIAVSAGVATGLVVSTVTYTVVTKTIQHPVAAIQTAVVFNPMIGPIYVATHKEEVTSGAKQIWNYLFG